MIDLINKAKQFKHNSFEHLDSEDILNSETLVDNNEALFIYTQIAEKAKIEWATDSRNAFFTYLKEAVDLISTHREVKKVHIEFIPEEYVDKMEGYGFKIISEWIDFWNYNLETYYIDLPEFIIVKNIEDNEYQKASLITKSCKGFSRGYNGESEEWLKEWNESDNTGIFIAKIDDEIVGLCCVSLYGFESEKGTVLWIREVAVEPKYHSRKIGITLLLSAIEWGKENGAKRSFLACDAENSKAIKLYERLGYDRKAKRGQINMEKQINV